jgi:hypothetical protein
VEEGGSGGREWRRVQTGEGRGMGVRENERNKGKRVELGIYIH